ncbi:MAG: hypothetical protein WC135_07045 [Bacteroidales bacterium]
MKKLILLLAVVFLFTSCKKEPVEVSGVITYYVNEYEGDKPDVGAEVYFTKINIDTIVDASIYLGKEELLATIIENVKSVEALKGTKSYNENNLLESQKEIKKIQLSLTEITNKYKMDKDALMDKAYFALTTILKDEKTMSVVADGSGRYSLKVAPEAYNLIVISKGKKGLNLLEIKGKIITLAIELKNKEAFNKDFRFTL